MRTKPRFVTIDTGDFSNGQMPVWDADNHKFINSSDSAAINIKGDWVTATAYVKNDVVEDGGSSYVCILAHTSASATEPGVGADWETYWQLFAQGTDSSTAVLLTGDQTIAGNKTFSSSPIIPTPTTGDNTTKAASTAFVKAAIDALINGAPGALDTLKELADALGDDADYAATITTALAAKAADSAVVHKTGAETVAGVKTFSSFPITPSSAPTTDYQTANKKYVDDNAGGGGASVTATAAEALTAGQIINIKSDGTVQLADATDATKPAVGYVDDDYEEEDTAKVLLGGIVTGLSSLTPGAAVFLSTTAGGITQTAPSGDGNIVQQIGVALTATSMMFEAQVAVEL